MESSPHSAPSAPGSAPPDVRIFEDRETLEREVSAWIANQLSAAARAFPRVSFALNGGTSPGPIYRRLSSEPLVAQINWPVLDLYFGDERCVPPDHPDSNYRAANEALVTSSHDTRVLAATWYRMEGERADRQAAADAYAARLPTQLDLIHLGMGDDGHTASLFPGHASLTERTRRVIAVTGSPKPPPVRITVTPIVLEAARVTFLTVIGEAKAAMVAKALEGPWDPEHIPVQIARRGVWFLDRAAASQLTRT